MLHAAAGDADCAKLLLDKGVAVNRHSDDVNRETALMRAVSLGKLKSTELLLAAGADPNEVGAYEKSALKEINRHTSNGEKLKALLIAAGATR
jgi:ankyrin repeat protein